MDKQSLHLHLFEKKRTISLEPSQTLSQQCLQIADANLRER
jgi:hypothetical protein